MKKFSILFFLIMFLIGTDSFLISPLLPTLALDFHVSTAASGWMVAVYSIGFALFTLVAGPFSDSRDRKHVILWGLSVFALATFLCAFAVNFAMMLVLRFIAGVAASFVTPQVWASVPRVAKPQDRMKLMGVVMSGLAGANLAGVPIGSFLAVSSWHLPFLTVGIATLLLILILSKFLPRLAPEKDTPQQSMHEIYGKVLKNTKALRYVLGFGLLFMGSISIFSFLGTWLAKDFHLTIGFIGVGMLFVGLGQFLGGLFGHRLTDKFGHKRWLAIAFGSWLVLALILPWMTTVVGAVLVAALIYLISGMTIPVIVMTIQNTAPESRGTMSSLSNFALYTGQSVGVALAGPLFAYFSGFFGVSTFAFLAMTLSALCFFWAGFWKKSEVTTAR